MKSILGNQDLDIFPLEEMHIHHKKPYISTGYQNPHNFYTFFIYENQAYGEDPALRMQKQKEQRAKRNQAMRKSVANRSKPQLTEDEQELRQHYKDLYRLAMKVGERKALMEELEHTYVSEKVYIHPWQARKEDLILEGTNGSKQIFRRDYHDAHGWYRYVDKPINPLMYDVRDRFKDPSIFVDISYIHDNASTYEDDSEQVLETYEDDSEYFEFEYEDDWTPSLPSEPELLVSEEERAMEKERKRIENYDIKRRRQLGITKKEANEKRRETYIWNHIGTYADNESPTIASHPRVLQAYGQTSKDFVNVYWDAEKQRYKDVFGDDVDDSRILYDTASMDLIAKKLGMNMLRSYARSRPGFKSDNLPFVPYTGEQMARRMEKGETNFAYDKREPVRDA